MIFSCICSRTPGSRQPSPAEETLPRPPTLLDPTQHSGFPTHPFNHMLNSMDHQGGGPGTQMNSYPPHQMQMGQLQPPVMNGVGGMQMAQVRQLIGECMHTHSIDIILKFIIMSNLLTFCSIF